MKYERWSAIYRIRTVKFEIITDLSYYCDKIHAVLTGQALGHIDCCMKNKKKTEYRVVCVPGNSNLVRLLCS